MIPSAKEGIMSTVSNLHLHTTEEQAPVCILIKPGENPSEIYVALCRQNVVEGIPDPELHHVCTDGAGSISDCLHYYPEFNGHNHGDVLRLLDQVLWRGEAKRCFKGICRWHGGSLETISKH